MKRADCYAVHQHCRGDDYEKGESAEDHINLFIHDRDDYHIYSIFPNRRKVLHLLSGLSVCETQYYINKAAIPIAHSSSNNRNFLYTYSAAKKELPPEYLSDTSCIIPYGYK